MCFMRHLGEMTIRSKLEELDRVTSFVASCAARVGMRRREILDSQISADEACSNVIAYAYPDSEGNIHITCDAGEGRFTITIADDGVPFNPLAIPEPDLASDADGKRLGGLGIHLIRTLMDDVRYERTDKMNVLTMLKRM